MDPTRGISFGGSSPSNPTPPLALSDLISHQPYSPYAYAYDRTVTGPEVTASEADGQSMQAVASGVGAQRASGQGEPPDLTATTPSEEKPPVGERPSLVDWQTTRMQLRPSRNQGAKADWIRGWSEGVGAHGEATYCACSEASSVVDQGGPTRGSEFKGGVRAILRGRRSVINGPSVVDTPVKPLATSSEPDVCRYCSRIPTPTVSAPVSVVADVYEPKRSLGQRLNGFFQRAKPGRRKTDSQGRQSSDSRRKNADIVQPSQVRYNMCPNKPQEDVADESSRQDLREKRTGRSNEIRRTNGRGPSNRPAGRSTPSAGSASNSDNPRGDDAISKSLSRLQRAAQLLHRAGQRDE